MWKGKNTHNIMRKDGEINFSKLEQQIDSAVEADKKYWVQNEAKIRAVNNKVASYEEFVDIVKASHLKPLEKGDRISDIKVFKQPWNINSGSGECSTVSQQPSDISCGSKSVTNMNQFIRYWKKQCKSSHEQFLFLIDMSSELILQIFQAEIGLGLLGEIISVLHEHYNSTTAEVIANVLYTLSKCGRFDLSLQFLSQKENDFLSGLIEKLSNDWNAENIYQLKEIYFKS